MAKKIESGVLSKKSGYFSPFSALKIQNPPRKTPKK